MIQLLLPCTFQSVTEPSLSDGIKPHQEDKHGLAGTTHHFLITQNPKYSTGCMKRSMTGIQMMKQTTVAHQSMTAAALRKSITKLEAIPHCLEVKQQHTGWRQRRREGAQTSRVVLGRRAKNGRRQCQTPRASQASTGHVSRLPGQLS